MKKLTKTKIHQSPPSVAAHLSLLPPAILTLTVVLSPQEREVLAYLISWSANYAGDRGSNSGSGSSGGDHAPLFDCDCFRCYMSYWVRWDASPNREVIHEIIDAYEDGQCRCMGTCDQKGSSYKLKGKKGRKKRSKGSFGNDRGKENEVKGVTVVNSRKNCEAEEEGELVEKGSMGKIVNFLRERIWGVWGYIMITYLETSVHIMNFS